MAKKENQSYRLINADIAQNCFKAIEKAVADSLDTPHNVVVTIGIDDDKARSNAQNSLYWEWVTRIANELGNKKEYQHNYLKRKFLSPILARDEPDKAFVFTKIKDCENTMTKAEYEHFAMSFASILTTTTLSTKQMAEYLNEVEMFGYEKGANMSVPKHLEWVR